MRQDDGEYGVHVASLRNMILQDRLDHQSLNREIDAIIAVKKSYTNNLRLERDKPTRALFESKLAAHDQRAKEVLAGAPLPIRMSDRAKALLELIDRSTLYSHMEGKGNTELISTAKDLQQKTLTSIAQSKMMVQASNEIGEKTLAELQHQRVQMADIEDNVSAVDGKLGQAAAYVEDYKTRISRDVFCRAMSVFNCLLVLLIVAFFALSSNNKR